MRTILKIFICTPLLILLAGCWNKFEMTEWGFVQAVAIDRSDEGKIELNVHIYKPGGDITRQMKGGHSYMNIRTEADSVFEAVRDIPLHLGRKAQWSHMRVILVGEELAKKTSMTDLVDFFERDHEPRETISITITQGRASDYLNAELYVENTIGQQVKTLQRAASRFSSKTTSVNLLDVIVTSKSEVNAMIVPYAQLRSSNAKKEKQIILAGAALLKDGKMKDSVLSPEQVKYYLMLADKYEGGIIDIPCDALEKTGIHFTEAFEVGELKTKMKPMIKGDQVTVQVKTEIEGTIGELHCSSIVDLESEKKLAQRIGSIVEERLRETVRVLQKQKTDVLGIGNQLYRHHPTEWQSWKKNWDMHFAQSQFDIHVDVTIHNVGKVSGKASVRH
ncbi:Ger(x)C family spore germination protein [Paenibacillus sp. y28]|uniref:Ger(x)C family spore germination protein n=1 Tax=Paenibacillus sp. y28 TaxID=3129110 RepID=UPI0030191D3F